MKITHRYFDVEHHPAEYDPSAQSPYNIAQISVRLVDVSTHVIQAYTEGGGCYDIAVILGSFETASRLASAISRLNPADIDNFLNRSTYSDGESI